MAGSRGYGKAKDHLRRDFQRRCAYCLLHEEKAGGDEHFEIDHFQPKTKGGLINDYRNLYWSCRGCNRVKSSWWPTPQQMSLDERFADPCAEQDYGVHFEELSSGYLRELTVCGKTHLLHLRLNRPNRLRLRIQRLTLWNRLNDVENRLARGNISADLHAFLSNMIEELKAEMSVEIPVFSPTVA